MVGRRRVQASGIEGSKKVILCQHWRVSTSRMVRRLSCHRLLYLGPDRSSPVRTTGASDSPETNKLHRDASRGSTHCPMNRPFSSVLRGALPTIDPRAENYNWL